MIVLTGGAGFIGSHALAALDAAGRSDVLVVDDLGPDERWRHLAGRRFRRYLHRDELWRWLEARPGAELEAVIHLGACTDTTEDDVERLLRVNTGYSRRLWRACARRRVPLVWASSAATYGDGSRGFSDRRETPEALSELEPLNPYGFSKHRFDVWAARRAGEGSGDGPAAPPCWAGLKFFNVYGPREAHKGDMASYVYQAILQARERGRVRLFRSTRPGLDDGEQRRDFVWVEDVVEVVLAFALEERPSGLYNVGTGRARSFNELVELVGRALGRDVEPEYIEMPDEVRGQYQHFTEAETGKLEAAGAAPDRWTPLEEGVERYVRWVEEREGG